MDIVRSSLQILDNFDRTYTIRRKLGGGSYGETFLIETKEGVRLVCKIFKGVTNKSDINEDYEILAYISLYSKACSLSRIKGIPEYHGYFQFQSNQIARNISFVPNYSKEVPSGTFKGLLMEYIPGENLQEIVDNLYGHEDRRLSWKSIVTIGREILFICNQLHSRGWAHRDIKPENIIISEGGNVYIVDLGYTCLASEVLSCKWNFEPTCKLLTGSAPYMAPEILTWKDSNNVPLSLYIPSDIYSFATVMYFMIYGTYPGSVVMVGEEGKNFMLNFRNILLKGIIPQIQDPEYEDMNFLNDYLSPDPEPRNNTQKVLRIYEDYMRRNGLQVEEGKLSMVRVEPSEIIV